MWVLFTISHFYKSYFLNNNSDIVKKLINIFILKQLAFKFSLCHKPEIENNIYLIINSIHW